MGVLLRILLIVSSTFSFVAFGGASGVGAAEDEVLIEGSGWGHGVGMSQYGAQAMAVTGSGYQTILAHYYQGTSIGTIPATTTIWVNLRQNVPATTLTVLSLPGNSGDNVVITHPGGTFEATTGASIAISKLGGSGCRLVVTNPSATAVTIDDADDCSVDLNWYSWNVAGQNPTTRLQIEGCTRRNLPCQYARGTMHLRHNALGNLDLSAEMRMDDYVLGISEMPYSWNMESLKVQAVAARSYAENRRVVRGDPATNSLNCWCHVRDTTADQAYVGWGHDVTGRWSQATTATANQVVTHPTYVHSVIPAYYSSSTGGKSEHGHEKGFTSGPVQWLTSVDDSHAVDGTVYNPNTYWSTTVSPASVASAVGLDYLTTMKVTKTRTSGSASEVTFKGLKDGLPATVFKTSAWVRTKYALKSDYFTVDYQAPPGAIPDLEGDEVLYYRTNGEYTYVTLQDDGTQAKVILSGSDYTSGWKSISSVDLDGDGRDEIMFYREDGLYRYYAIGADAQVGAPIRAGDDYTSGWDSISAVDLDGDGRDEMFFYREDGLYRYYNVRPDGRIGSPIRAGDDYTSGWDSISAVDLDGDGRDEMFFYREDGLYRYYNVRPDGRIGSPIRAGDDYSSDWSAITAVDLDGDAQDEMFFYRVDGLYRYYNVSATGSLGSPIRAGAGFGANWDVITEINLDGS